MPRRPQCSLRSLVIPVARFSFNIRSENAQMSSFTIFLGLPGMPHTIKALQGLPWISLYLGFVKDIIVSGCPWESLILYNKHRLVEISANRDIIYLKHWSFPTCVSVIFPFSYIFLGQFPGHVQGSVALIHSPHLVQHCFWKSWE